MIDLDKLEALHREATPGEWRAVIEGTQPVCYYRALVCFSANTADGGYVSVVTDDHLGVREHQANALFVAAVHEMVPGLIAELREARAKIGRLSSAIDELTGVLQMVTVYDDTEEERDACAALASAIESALAAQDSFCQRPTGEIAIDPVHEETAAELALPAVVATQPESDGGER